MLPCNISRFGLKLFGFSRRRCYFFAAISFVFFVLNVLLISNYLDVRFPTSRRLFENRFHDHHMCELTDDLAKSAYKRMKTQECRHKLSKFYCEISKPSGFPVEQIENHCPAFDLSLRDAYVGCYKDEAKNRFLTGFMYKFLKENTPKHCVQACLRAGYQYAGVEYTFECFCGDGADLNPERKVEDQELCKKYRCPGDNSTFCGGFNAIAVYSTGILEKNKPIPDYIPLLEEKSDQKVKILFLFQLNGRNTRQIKRVLRMMYSPKHLYFFHVDYRQAYMYKELEKMISDLHLRGVTNIFLTPKRYATIWGGSSLLEMFIDIVKTSFTMKEFAGWDYILNLSETDMPILSLEELEHNLATHKEKSFLSSHGYNTANFIQKQGFNYYFFECENRMWRIKNRTNFPKNLRIDGGSDWVIVHRDLAEFAISDEDEYVKSMRTLYSTILLPLEGFFHSLALNSQFCDRVLYKNLRLTNWKRKQGCRCAMLKDVVDWCGCSPIALKLKVDDIGLEKAKKKALFFARKFESLIDIDAVAQAERQVLRFRPNLMVSSSPVFNSTWINFYDRETDSGSSKKPLFELWSKIIFDEWKSTQISTSHAMRTHECPYEALQEIHAYKAFSSAPIQLILTISDTCGNDYEFLVERKQDTKISENAKVENYQLVSMEFGVNLDLKEDIFRDFTGLVDTSGTATLLWHWHYNSTSDQKLNSTSPKVNIQWYSPQGRMIRNDPIKPYDSINYAQLAHLNLGELQEYKEDVNPGIWHAKLLSSDGSTELAEINFIVFPDLNDVLPYSEENLATSLVKRSYKVLDVCSRNFQQPQMFICPTSTYWSTLYPDPKSDFVVNL